MAISCSNCPCGQNGHVVGERWCNGDCQWNGEECVMITVPPPEVVTSPPEVVTSPPQVVTSPPEMVTSPPQVVTSPPEVATSPPEVVPADPLPSPIRRRHHEKDTPK